MPNGYTPEERYGSQIRELRSKLEEATAHLITAVLKLAKEGESWGCTELGRMADSRRAKLVERMEGRRWKLDRNIDAIEELGGDPIAVEERLRVYNVNIERISGTSASDFGTAVEYWDWVLETEDEMEDLIP